MTQENAAEKREIRFHFSRASDDRPTVPASILIQTLQSAQRAIWLIAMAKEQKDIRSRVRIPEEIEQRYQLRCRAAESGSYDLPTYVESNSPLLPTLDQIDSVLDAFEGVAEGLRDQNADVVARWLPDSGVRRRVVAEFQRLAPKPGSGWRLDVGRSTSGVRLDDKWKAAIQKMYQPADSEPITETVNGRLIEVKFPDRRVTIQLLGTTLSMELTYPEELEDVLLEKRRDVIQVTGQVLRDEDGQVKRIFNVEAIEPLELAPLSLNEVTFDGTRLRFEQPYTVEPKLDPNNGQLICVEDESLGLRVFAGTVSAVLDEVAMDLVMIWRHIALESDDKLAPSAIDVKRRLLAAMEEAPIGG